jgi:hypothetical protein
VASPTIAAVVLADDASIGAARESGERRESEAALIATLPDRHVLRLSGTWMLEIPA